MVASIRRTAVALRNAVLLWLYDRSDLWLFLAGLVAGIFAERLLAFAEEPTAGAWLFELGGFLVAAWSCFRTGSVINDAHRGVRAAYDGHDDDASDLEVVDHMWARRRQLLGWITAAISSFAGSIVTVYLS